MADLMAGLTIGTPLPLLTICICLSMYSVHPTPRLPYSHPTTHSLSFFLSPLLPYSLLLLSSLSPFAHYYLTPPSSRFLCLQA